MSSKDSYWFRHDASAGRGLKMRKMAHIYAHWGKGVYWDVVEILRDQKDYKFESDESSLGLLCDLIGCKDNSRFVNWFNDSLRLGLFELDEDFFFCPPLTDNMKVWEVKKNNGSKGGRPKKKTELKPNHNLSHNLNGTITEQEIIEDNKTVVVGINELFETFKKEVKNGNHDAAIEQMYIRLKIRKGTLTPLIKLFNGQLITDGKVHKNTEEFKKHFNNWLNTQDMLGKLNEYKRQSQGQL